MQCTHTKENNILIAKAGINDALRLMFNFKGYYYTVHDGVIMISDHPAKIERKAGKCIIKQIPLSYNGWLVWKSYIIGDLEYLMRND